MRLVPVGLATSALFAVIVLGGGATAGTPAASTAPAGRQAAAGQKTAVGAAIPYSVGRALPDRASGWTRAAQIQMYSPGDLWEYINGAAEQYLTYGFQDLAAAKYTHATGASVTVDIYRMADAVNAFGIYAQEVTPKARPVALGVEGRAGSSTVKFWSGRFYVKITAASGTAAGQAPIVALGTAVADGLGPAGSMPSQLQWFPVNGLVPGSIKYVPADVLGQSMFTNAFEAKYEAPREPSTVVVVPFENEDRARAALGRYESFLAKPGGAVRPVASPGNGGFSTTDGFYGLVVAVRAGAALTISLGAADVGSASAILAEIVRRMPPAPPGPPRKAGVS